MPVNRNMNSALRGWWLGGHSKYAYSHPLFRRTSGPPRKVRVLGDHSDYHCGSWAAIESIRMNCVRSGYALAGRYEPFDILVVNGEGSMHGSRSGFRNVFTKKMEVLKRAVERGIPAYLVNTIWQDNVSSYDDVLRQLSGIQVREAESQRALLEEHGVSSTLKIDASFFLDVDIPPNCERTSRVIANDFFITGTGRFESHALDIPNVEYVAMKDVRWPDFVRMLASSRLLVTGRHHAVYAACKARTPFIVVKGNNHKVTGLLASAGVNVPVVADISGIPSALKGIDAYAGEFEKLFDWMHAQPDTPILPLREPG